MNLLHKNIKQTKIKLTILKGIINALKVQKILLSKNKFIIFKNSAYLTFEFFFFLKKYLIKYKKKKIKRYKILNFLKKLLTDFNVVSVLIKIINLNKTLEILQIKKIYYKLKRFKFTLFKKKSKLLILFSKLTILVLKNKLNLSTYLEMIVKVFQSLTKKQHSKFLFFMRFLLKLLITQQLLFSDIKGGRFLITGRLKGKPRSSKKVTIKGKLLSSTLTSKINYSCIHAYTKYGKFGLKLWLNYDNT